jgi:hypothetical protein
MKQRGERLGARSKRGEPCRQREVKRIGSGVKKMHPSNDALQARGALFCCAEMLERSLGKKTSAKMLEMARRS